ncbi:MAG TPA: rhodanese-like domain-containing protein [Ornithinimicrobium sp.]|uniref:sulfurtransferase n=1 Tax=Ornithinimicrobium sp. TaxID=1977084 RepID=UPI002B4A7218|nr:rhodanese-like domain-containing protein [Ornithinimicrobium sp.]HKJ12039.1 rhodanese-like domain-containing protein [Ornithinimicrobium sp.]
MSAPMISVPELAEAMAGPQPTRPTMVDVRWQLGRGFAANHADYVDGHLPEAGFLDLDSGLAGRPGPRGRGGRHPMPSITAATDAFRAAGVSDSRPVVFYDESTSLAAARAWWVLRYFGHEDVRVLDGGFARWVADGQPWTTGGYLPPRGDVTLRSPALHLVQAEEIATGVLAGPLLDARAPERYRGEVEPIDPVAGHIPGALNVPTLALLHTDGRLRPDRLRAAVEDLGVDPASAPTLYCGSGVQAAHLALTWEATFPASPEPALYIGSWSDWISDSERAVAQGDEGALRSR